MTNGFNGLFNVAQSPLAQVLSAARNGADPRQTLAQIAAKNPQAAAALNMMRGKNPQQLRQMAQNMAKERGTTVEEVMRSLGMTIR